MSRWYDKRPNLGKKLDAFKDMEPKVRDPIIRGVMDLVQQYEPSLLSYEKAYDFPFDCDKRRWYDNDPHLWLMFNILKVADDTLLQLVEDYLEKQIKGDWLTVA